LTSSVASSASAVLGCAWAMIWSDVGGAAGGGSGDDAGTGSAAGAPVGVASAVCLADGVSRLSAAVVVVAGPVGLSSAVAPTKNTKRRKAKAPASDFLNRGEVFRRWPAFQNGG